MRYEQMPKSNLHTHTTFCDGAHSAEENVLSAIQMGMDTLGFSGHSAVFFADYAMSHEGTEEYRKEILRLRQVYGDRLNILLGIEQDYYADMPAEGFEYIIGSVHHLFIDGEYYAVDENREEFVSCAQKCFGGDYYRFAKAYYELVAQVLDKTKGDIVGHFDLFSKFNEGGIYFDENDPRYLHPAMEALDALLERDTVFEVNTGAISRGYRKTPYPATPFLRRIAEKRGRVTLNADSHHKDWLLTSYPEALALMRASGLGSVLVMTREGWKNCPL